MKKVQQNNKQNKTKSQEAQDYLNYERYMIPKIAKKIQQQMYKSKQQQKQLPIGGESRKKKDNMENLNTKIKHRELLTSIEGSVFSQQSFTINPGLSSFSEWLSPIANNFESYYIEELQFEFVPQTSSLTTGAIYMAIDYDAADLSDITSIKEIAQMQGVVSGNVWQGQTVDFQKYKKWRYTRHGEVSFKTAIQDYDAGRFHVLVSGAPPEVILGQVYVNYVLKLQTPQPARIESKIMEIVEPYNATSLQTTQTTGNTSCVYNRILQGSLFTSDWGINAPYGDGATAYQIYNRANELVEYLMSFGFEYSGSQYDLESIADGIFSVIKSGGVEMYNMLAEPVLGQVMPWQIKSINSGKQYIQSFVKFLMPKDSYIQFVDHPSVSMAMLDGINTSWSLTNVLRI